MSELSILAEEYNAELVKGLDPKNREHRKLLDAAEGKKISVKPGTVEVDGKTVNCVIVKFPKGTHPDVRRKFNKGYIRRKVNLVPGFYMEHYLVPLDTMTRTELNDAAKLLRIADPEKVKDKAALIAEIDKAMAR